MRRVKTFVVEHSVVAYFALTFAISWGGVLLLIGSPNSMAGVQAQDSPLFPFVLLAMVAGPSTAGLALTGVIDGRPGLRELRSRLLAWRVNTSWYALALLPAPIMAVTARWALTFVAEEPVPTTSVTQGSAQFLVFVLIVALTAGFCEELGWTGFVVPRLKRHHGVLATGLVVGILWSAWHVLVVAWGIGDRAGTVPLPVFMLVDGCAGLPAFRALMVWVYDRTDSLWIGVLMHISLTLTTLTLTPQTTGVFLLAYGVTFAAGIWLVLAAAMASREHWRPARTYEEPTLHRP